MEPIEILLSVYEKQYLPTLEGESPSFYDGYWLALREVAKSFGVMYEFNRRVDSLDRNREE